MRKIKDILIDNGFRFNHNLGQNFITDKNLLDKIVELSGVDENDVVVEIGTGAGTLTRAIAEKAKKVYSFEVDRALKPVLDETLSGLDNVEVIFKDVLKMKDKELLEIVGEKIQSRCEYSLLYHDRARNAFSGRRRASVGDNRYGTKRSCQPIRRETRNRGLRRDYYGNFLIRRRKNRRTG